MTHALENYNSTISIRGRQITNLRFADYINGITGRPGAIPTPESESNDDSDSDSGVGIICSSF